MAKEFKLEITFNAETKDCGVKGPINEPELCYLGLELARRVIEQHAKKRIIVPMPMVGQSPKKVGVQLPDLRKLLENGG